MSKYYARRASLVTRVKHVFQRSQELPYVGELENVTELARGKTNVQPEKT